MYRHAIQSDHFQVAFECIWCKENQNTTKKALKLLAHDNKVFEGFHHFMMYFFGCSTLRFSLPFALSPVCSLSLDRSAMSMSRSLPGGLQLGFGGDSEGGWNYENCNFCEMIIYVFRDHQNPKYNVWTDFKPWAVNIDFPLWAPFCFVWGRWFPAVGPYSICINNGVHTHVYVIYISKAGAESVLIRFL